MSNDIEQRIEAIERAVPDAVRVRGHSRLMSLSERMAARMTPGLSVAVLNKGRLEWARGYGAVAAGGAPVEERTLFQAASISKPVAAFGAMILADQGKLDLDADVDGLLKSWHLSQNASGYEQRVTVRRILSHTAGLTLDGMPGYAPATTLPSTTQILEGAPPAVNSAIRVAAEPGSEFRYSGGGYTILELIISDVTGQPFSEFVTDAVLEPCGMLDSTFAQPLPAELAERAACGHNEEGVVLPGNWEVMPALAASGLWTTAADLCRFAAETQRALSGESRPTVPVGCEGDAGDAAAGTSGPWLLGGGLRNDSAVLSHGVERGVPRPHGRLRRRRSRRRRLGQRRRRVASLSGSIERHRRAVRLAGFSSGEGSRRGRRGNP